ncbi:hypothetical protein PORY_000433 [Pneumocystis oryctolagi]|uniref:Uncharacterized protein n=1 Tax=Pneumocystis oryctolagi TaxID=42067 RepID=A0ACB7CGT4_9ASCO|nr:hypothetical protein PORY_000433 [Pneumocystis oryctolagi]
MISEVELDKNEVKISSSCDANEKESVKIEFGDAMVFDYQKNVLDGVQLMNTVNIFDDKKHGEIQVECLGLGDPKASVSHKKDIRKERFKKKRINGLNIEGDHVGELEINHKLDIMQNTIKKSQINYNNIKSGNIELYCVCQKPDTGCWMIACDGCDNWYHGECVKIAKMDEELLDKYFCESCTKKGKGCTMWKRKCRLSSCRKPAIVSVFPPSKYCSKEHGVEYFKEKLCHSMLERSEIAALARSVSSVDAFKCLGDSFPFEDNSIIDSESLSLLKLINVQREEVYERLKQIEIRTVYINYAKDRAKKINEEIRADGSKKEICALDYRLSWNDDDWNAWIISDDGKKILDDGKLESYDLMCITEKRKCFKHNNWVTIKIEEMELEEIICRQTLKKLRKQEKKIYKRQRKLKALDKESKGISIAHVLE